MPQIFSIAQTILRDPDSKKDPVNVPAGKRLGVTILPDRGQSILIRLAGDDEDLGLGQGEEWKAYQPHWNLPDLWKGRSPNPPSIKLKVPYFAQCDSRSDGYRYCFSHACAMMAAYLLSSYSRMARGYSQLENFYIDVVLKHGDTTSENAQLAALAEIGVKAYFSQTISPKDMYLAMELGIPLPMGVAYKSSGHWVTLVGSDHGDWLIHDPYGIRDGSTNSYVVTATDTGREGAYDPYSPAVMDAIYFDQRVNADRECGWAIIPISVAGHPTDLPEGL